MFKEIYSFTVEDVREVQEKTKEKRKNDKGVEEEVEITKKVEKKYLLPLALKNLLVVNSKRPIWNFLLK